MTVIIQTKDAKILDMFVFFNKYNEAESCVQYLPDGNIIKGIREASIGYDIR